MKYVKLIARPNTWFKEGTEVFHYDSDLSEKRRLTLDEWEEWKKYGMVLVRGIRISDTLAELDMFGDGEREDGESCICEEFNVEIIEQ